VLGWDLLLNFAGEGSFKRGGLKNGGVHVCTPPHRGGGPPRWVRLKQVYK
jgi:hypothetical protein